MPAIDHLLGRGRSFTGPTCIFCGRIAAEVVDARMGSEPLRKGVGCAIRQQIDWSMARQIHEQCAVGMTTPKGEIIDPQRFWDGEGLLGRPLGQAQEGSGADHNAHVAQQASCWLTAHLATVKPDARCQPLRPLPMGSHNLRSAFSKRSLWTSWGLTAKSTHAQHPSHRFAADGQILGRTRIVTMNGLRWVLTPRARRRGLLGRGADHHGCLLICALRNSKTRELIRERIHRKPPTSVTSPSHFYLRSRVAIPLHERCG